MVYAPALAMNQVAGLDINIAILLVGIVCMVYTSLGGMKAVVWTDVYQSIWMFSGFAILVIVASFDFEGFGNVLKAVQRGHRGTPQFEIDPRYRKSYILATRGQSWTVQPCSRNKCKCFYIFLKAYILDNTYRKLYGSRDGNIRLSTI